MTDLKTMSESQLRKTKHEAQNRIQAVDRELKTRREKRKRELLQELRTRMPG